MQYNLHLQIYQPFIFEFRNYWQSLLSTLFYRWWKPGASEMVASRYTLGIIWNILYQMYWLFILLNVFRAIIITNGFDNMKEASLQESGIWSYLWRKLRKDKKVWISPTYIYLPRKWL